jgi:hypothetical protein
MIMSLDCPINTTGIRKAIDTLVVYVGKLRAQQVVDVPIAEPAPCWGEHRRVPIAVSREPHKPTGVAFRPSC